MGRGIEFDYVQAIDRATNLFWKHGYANTSLRELLKAMGIGEGSFYNTVKSKKNLYLECLKHYRETVGRKREEALLSGPSVKLAMRAYFKVILDQLDEPASPRACLMGNSMSCEVLDTKEFRDYFLSQVSIFGGKFVERLKSGQDTGELSRDFAPEIVARIVGTYTQGLLRGTQLFYNRKQLEMQIEVFLTGMGF